MTLHMEPEPHKERARRADRKVEPLDSVELFALVEEEESDETGEYHLRNKKDRLDHNLRRFVGQDREGHGRVDRNTKYCSCRNTERSKSRTLPVCRSFLSKEADCKRRYQSSQVPRKSEGGDRQLLVRPQAFDKVSDAPKHTVDADVPVELWRYPHCRSFNSRANPLLAEKEHERKSAYHHANCDLRR